MLDLKELASTLGLDSASTKRLSDHISGRFVDNLEAKPVFDDRIRDVVKNYSVGEVDIDSEIGYLDDMKYGCYYRGSMIVDQIQHFAEPEKDSFAWNSNYQKALRQVWEVLKPIEPLRVIKYRSDEDIDNVLTKKDTSAGFEFILTGKRLKGEYIDGIYPAYKKELKKALECGTFSKPIISGTRMQVSGAYDDYGVRTGVFKDKTRLVSMIDLFLIIAECQFAKPFQHYMHGKKFYAMGKLPDEQHNLIVTMAARYSRWYSLDYSRYDQTIPSWLIRDAFELIWRCFDAETRENYRALFEVIVHDFIHKHFVSEGGRIVSAHKGVPSGSMFTSVIDTICNYIMIMTYFNSLENKIQDTIKKECCICGDDNLICTNYKLDLNDLASYLNHNFGIDVHPEKCSASERVGQPPKFLSREWQLRGAYREPRVLLANMCYPERFRDYIKNPDLKPEMILYSYYLAYPIGMQHLIDVERFLDDFRLEIPKWGKEIFKYQSGWYSFQRTHLGLAA